MFSKSWKFLLCLIVFTIIGGLTIDVSAYDNPLSVGFKSQVPPGEWTNTNNCGQTSALMVMCYHDGTIPTEQGIKDIDDWLFQEYNDPINNYNGSLTNTTKIEALVKEYGGFDNSYKDSNWDLNKLKLQIDAGLPVIAAVIAGYLSNRGYSYSDGHFLVVTGYTSTDIICNDPGSSSGNKKYYSNNEFSQAFFAQNGSVVMVVPSCASTPQNRSLARIEGQGTVYWLQNDKAYHVLSPQIISDMFSFPGWDHICDYPSNVFEIITPGHLAPEGTFLQGPDFISTDSESDGLLIKPLDDPKGYLVENGERRWISSQEIFESLGFDLKDVITITESILSLLPEGDPIYGTLNIISPTHVAPDFVGKPDSPEKTSIEVKVGINGGAFISDLQKDDFTVLIGGITANIVTAIELSDKYVLNILPPVQSGEGLYDLEVTVLGNSEVETGAIQYAETTQANVDVVLTLDRSGSMGTSSYMEPAKNAAKLFVDQMKNGDMVSVVSFSSVAGLNYPLTEITSSTIIAEAKDAITSISSSGGTSIGAGLQISQTELNDGGEGTHPWAIVLLSDGFENEVPYVSTILPGILSTKTKIFSIALGSNSDESLLQDMASQTGGQYYFSPTENDLTGIYSSLSSQVSGLQTLFSESGTVYAGGTDVKIVGIDPSVREAVFLITWSGSGSDLQLELESPYGNVIDSTTSDPNVTFVSGSNSKSFTVKNPPSGSWILRVNGGTISSSTLSIPSEILREREHWIDTGNGDTAPDMAFLASEMADYSTTDSDLQFNANVTAVTLLTTDVYLDKGNYDQGDSIKIAVSVADTGPITGASVFTNATTPSSSSSFLLYDDGQHGDGALGDGIYANTYTKTKSVGTYSFIISVAGTNTTGSVFSRVAHASTYIRDAEDTDGDGMSDTWELRVGLDINTNDSGGNPDTDQLTNIEEYENGTDPFKEDTDTDQLIDGEEVNIHGTDPTKWDTDTGGEGDGSEVLGGRNPLVAGDDVTGEGTTFFSSDFESGPGDWTLNFPWEITEESHVSGTHCLSDSPGGDYQNNADTSASITIDLTDAVFPVLSFWTRYEFENYKDFAFVEVSSDNGVTWARRYFATGSQSEWQQVRIDLSSYAHQPQVMIRFRLTSNGSLTYDGWYIDDVKVEETATVISYPFYDDMEGGLDNWYASSWQTTSLGYGSDTCVTDSPFGNYLQYNKTYLTLAGTIDLSGSVNPQLTFRHHYNTYNSSDRCYVQLGYHDGQSWHWTNVAQYYGSQASWQRVQLDLSSYSGQSQVLIRFLLNDDGVSTSYTGDGWYVDNVAIQDKPQAVTLNTPTIITKHSMDISWTESPDLDFKQYQLYRDITGGVNTSNTCVATITDKAQTSFHDHDLLIGQTYYYKIYVRDTGDAYSDGSNEVAAATLNVAFPLSDDLESGTDNWDVSPPWGLTSEEAYSGSFSFADSPGSNYGDNEDTSLRTSFDLTDAVFPVLSFWTRYEFENYKDFAFVEVSSDNGVTWARRYFATGNQGEWTKVHIDLSSYAHLSQVMIRFRLTSNGSLTYDGWYIDDVKVEETTTVISYPFYDDMEGGLDNWYASSWQTTSLGYGSDTCVTDSPFGNYLQYNKTYLSLAGTIDLSGAVNPQLTFWHHYNTRQSYDFCYVQLGYYDGQSWHWTNLAQYTGSQTSWQRKQLDLSSYAGQSQVVIRFFLETSYSSSYDGWYVDNVYIGEEDPSVLPLVDWATIDRPEATAVLVGTPTERIYGWVYEPGTTDIPGQGPGISAQLGYGPDSSMPGATWTWVTGRYNGDAGASDEYDEYYASFRILTPGTYDYAYRYSLDGGNTWIYADLDGNDLGSTVSNGYSPSQAGSLLVSEVGMPDLVVLSIACDPASPEVGEDTTVYVTIKNQGVVDAEEFYVDFYKDLTTSPYLGEVGDLYWYPAGLGAGETQTLVDVISYTTAGDYSMYAQIDSFEQIEELNETNNIFGPQTIHVVPADSCECDLTNDGKCDMQDWLKFGEEWGHTDCNEPGVDCECDLNVDGKCDMQDWLCFGEDWGRTDCP